MYFLIMTVKNLVNKQLIIVFCLSVILTPLLYILLNDWGVMISGLFSGTLVFILFRKKKHE